MEVVHDPFYYNSAIEFVVKDSEALQFSYHYYFERHTGPSDRGPSRAGISVESRTSPDSRTCPLYNSESLN